MLSQIWGGPGSGNIAESDRRPRVCPALTPTSSSGGKSKSVELEDVKFHQCVRLSRFENDRTISFIPPDGEFELMSYRLNTHVSAPSSHHQAAMEAPGGLLSSPHG